MDPSHAARPARAASLALSALALAAPASAGTLALERSNGVLGGAAVYDLEGDPFELALLVPSLTAGPTPLALVDPSDPRVLEVGLDLLHLARLVPLDASGHGTHAYSLPPDPSLAGIALHAQALTVPGAATLVDDLSPATAFVLAAAQSVHLAIGPFAEPRQGHTATPLPGGTVLVAGGDRPDGSGGLTALATLEVYDPQTQSSTLLPASLAHPRSTHTATALADGRVLLAGGYDGSTTVVATAELFDPATGSVVPAASMSVPRTQHTATLLADGRVLVAGGTSKFDTSAVLSSLAQAKRSTELYDPAADAWTSGPDLPLGGANGIVGHAASRLSGGDVLLSGGAHVSIFIGIPIPSLARECYRFDPSSGSFSPAADLPSRRVFHGQETLPDGRALAVGGADGDTTTLSFHALASTATYEPAADAWTPAAPLTHARAYPQIVVVPGEVLVLAGLAAIQATTGTGTPEVAIDAAPLPLGSWTHVADGILPRQVARAAAVEGGARVVIVGTGDDGTPAPSATAEVYVR